MPLAISTVTASIAALDISGVNFKDTNEMLDEVKQRSLPLLMPAPNFFTDPSLEDNSLGTGAEGLKSAFYTLNYRYFHQKVGVNRTNTLAAVFPDMVRNVGLIWDKIIANDTVDGAIDIALNGISPFGVVADMVGGEFFGCDLSIRVMEFVN